MPARARLKHYTGGTWDEHTASSEWGATTTSTTQAMTRTHITSFSPFGVVAAAPLPVKLTTFDVQASGTAALCTWQTASETNNDHFVVERSLDGTTFAPSAQWPARAAPRLATPTATPMQGPAGKVPPPYTTFCNK